jgi:hypothetical protein
MLTPMIPRPGTPDYPERLRRFHLAREARLRHPEDWGFVRPVAGPAPAQDGSAASPAPDGSTAAAPQPGQAGRERGRVRRHQG